MVDLTLPLWGIFWDIGNYKLAETNRSQKFARVPDPSIPVKGITTTSCGGKCSKQYTDVLFPQWNYLIPIPRFCLYSKPDQGTVLCTNSGKPIKRSGLPTKVWTYFKESAEERQNSDQTLTTKEDQPSQPNEAHFATSRFSASLCWPRDQRPLEVLGTKLYINPFATKTHSHIYGCLKIFMIVRGK